MRSRYEFLDIGYLEMEQQVAANRVMVTSIVVEEQYQNLGVGTALMNVMLRDADLEGKEIWLVPQPLGEDLLPALERFYGRLGFEYLGERRSYMRWFPSPKAPTGTAEAMAHTIQHQQKAGSINESRVLQYYKKCNVEGTTD